MRTVPAPQAFVVHKVLYAHHAIDHSLGPWRTSGDVYVYRDDLVDAL
jgi:hypothetical protein